MVDTAVWFCQKCNNTLHRVEYWRDNKAMKIKEVAAALTQIGNSALASAAA
jgi:hypothetical protein